MTIDKAMKKSGILQVAAILLAAVLPLAAAPVRDLGELQGMEAKTEALAEKVMPSVVCLVSEQSGASGSGVIVREDGLILTAAHVTDGADEVDVIFPSGKQTRAKVLGSNFSKDIGMAQITEDGPWPAVEIGDSKPLKAGDWVVAMGHSEGYDPGRTPPVRFGRVVSDGPGNFLTTDCTLIGGDSGGPLFDLDGRVVGINSSIGESLSNNNHAGVTGFGADWDRLVAGEKWGELELNPLANPERPVLGIAIAGERRDGAVVVGRVTPGGPAQAAGIRGGDEIVSIDGGQVTGEQGMVSRLLKKEGGDPVTVGLRRGKETFEVEVTLSRFENVYGEETAKYQKDRFLRGGDEEVPLQRPEERLVTSEQSQSLFDAIRPVARQAGQSTVWVWANGRQVAVGTVVGDGTQVLTKWSQVALAKTPIQVVDGNGTTGTAVVSGVYQDDDVAVLQVEGATFEPIAWTDEAAPPIGGFLVASGPGESPLKAGVVAVAERTLRESDQAFIGVSIKSLDDRSGVRVEEIDERGGADEAGIREGDVITAIAGEPVTSSYEMRTVLLNHAPGDVVAVSLLRKGETLELEVELTGRPEFPGLSEARLRHMRRMGGRISVVGDGFPTAIQTDMQLKPEECGGPVVDLDGRVIGLSISRTDRTRSFILPASRVRELLTEEPMDPTLASLPGSESEQAPRARVVAPMRRGSANLLRHHLEEMSRLLDRMEREMEPLER